MANPQRGEVEFAIGVHTYTLAIGLNAMCEIQEKVSTPDQRVTFKEALEGAIRGDMVFLRAVLWGSLRRHHPEIGIVNVESILEEAGGMLPFLPQFVPVLTKLIDYSKPDEADRGAVKKAGGAGRPPTDPAVMSTITTPSISRRVKSA